jgi:hypothetical protein
VDVLHDVLVYCPPTFLEKSTNEAIGAGCFVEEHLKNSTMHFLLQEGASILSLSIFGNYILSQLKSFFLDGSLPITEEK